MAEDEVLFEERQSFGRWLLWVFIVGFLGVVLVDAGFGDESTAETAIGIAVLVGIGLLFVAVSLTVQVRPDGVYVKFVPRHLSFHRIPWSDIEAVEARTYNPILVFGGWGLRWEPGRIAYTVGGREAVVLYRRSHRELWLGTKRSEEFVAAVDEARGTA